LSDFFIKGLRQAKDGLTILLDDPHLQAQGRRVIALLSSCFQNGGKVLICGNGGSACDAMHFAEECTGRFRQHRKALPALSLTDSAHITCVANDYGFSEVFARGVEAYARPEDVLIVLSTSGNSENVIKALHQAKALSLKTVALLGPNGGQAKSLVDEALLFPGETTDRIQELHMVVLHLFVEGIEHTLFSSSEFTH